MNTEEYKTKLLHLSKELYSFNSNLADIDPKLLKKMFKIVYKSGVLDIVSLEKELQDIYKIELFTTLTKYSGALAFLVIQTLAANNIMRKNDFSKQEFYLKQKCGIAINHLRAPKTVIEGTQVEDGYILNGTLTWASGFKIFDSLIIGFHCGEYEIEAIVPFEHTEGFKIGSCDQTFVGFGLSTVNIALDNYFVKDSDIISSHNKGNFVQNKSTSKTVHFCIYGLGVNSLEYIQDKELVDHAKNKLIKIKDKINNTTDPDKLDSLRIKLFNLVLNTVTTGMILNGGSSILNEKPLQRIYRELIMFNSNGLNNTLKSLFKKQFLKK